MTTSSRILPRLLALAAVLAAAAGPAGAAELRSVTGLQPGGVVWMHAAPDAASPRVGYLRAGATRVRTSECRTLAAGGWCRVIVRGTRGWVRDRFLKVGGGVMRG